MDWNERLKLLPTRLVEIIDAHAATRPDAIAVSDARGRRSFRDLAHGIAAIATELRQAGVRPGDRVVLVAENRFESVCAVYAITSLDAWSVMANARLTAPEIDTVAAISGARLVVYSSGDQPETHVHARGQARCIANAAYGVLAFGPLDASAAPEPVHADPRAQVAATIFTSGSTGKPKGVMLTHSALAHQCALSTVERGYRDDDCLYVVAPITHIFGFSSMMLAPLYAGAELRMAPRFEIEATVKAMQENVTRIYGAPPMFAALVERARRTGEHYRDCGLRDVISGGAVTDQSLRDHVHEVFGIPLGVGYAATEYTPIAGSNSLRPAGRDAVGPVWRTNELRIVDAAGTVLASGDTGEIEVRGPCMMIGYYRDEAATRDAIKPGGWLATGDLGFLDANGELRVVGRLKEVIVRSGFKVNPPEVEAALDRHPAIAQSVVVGRSVPGNEEVIAFVQLRQSALLDLADLDRHLRVQLAPYKLPSRIEVLEALPLGTTGKVMRLELAQRARTLA